MFTRQIFPFNLPTKQLTRLILLTFIILLHGILFPTLIFAEDDKQENLSHSPPPPVSVTSRHAQENTKSSSSGQTSKSDEESQLHSYSMQQIQQLEKILFKSMGITTPSSTPSSSSLPNSMKNEYTVPDYLHYLYENHRLSRTILVGEAPLNLEDVSTIRLHQHTSQYSKDTRFVLQFDVEKLLDLLMENSEALHAVELRFSIGNSTVKKVEELPSDAENFFIHLYEMGPDNSTVGEMFHGDIKSSPFLSSKMNYSLNNESLHYWISIDVTALLQKAMNLNKEVSIFQVLLELSHSEGSQFQGKDEKHELKYNLNKIASSLMPQLISFSGSTSKKRLRRSPSSRPHVHPKLIESDDSSNHRSRRSADDYSNNNPMDGTSHYSNKCHRRTMWVNFDTIGWASWIVSPKIYEAGYCGGTCPFPLSDLWNSTNHAIIQQVLHEIDHEMVPPPVCVPTTLEPLTLMYYEGKLVQLKKFSDMVIRGCGCR